MVLKEIVQSLIVFYSSVGRLSWKFQSVGFPENNSLFLLTPNGIPKVTCCSIGWLAYSKLNQMLRLLQIETKLSLYYLNFVLVYFSSQ